MDPEREKVARETMAPKVLIRTPIVEEPPCPRLRPSPRRLPAWNDSVMAILSIERQINDIRDGGQLSRPGRDF